MSNNVRNEICSADKFIVLTSLPERYSSCRIFFCVKRIKRISSFFFCSSAEAFFTHNWKFGRRQSRNLRVTHWRLPGALPLFKLLTITIMHRRLLRMRLQPVSRALLAAQIFPMVSQFVLMILINLFNYTYIQFLLDQFSLFFESYL